MKRTLKNVILILLILITCVCVYFTMKNIKQNTTNSQTQQMGEPKAPDINQSQNMGEDSETEQKGTQISNTSENSDTKMPEPPEKPEGENQNATAPEMPNGENQNSTMPEMPAGNSEGQKPDNMPTTGQNEITTIETKYYIIFGVESFVISALTMYLVMSKFNKYTFKQTVTSADKAIIFVLAIIIITAVLMLLNVKITEKYFVNNSSSNNQNSNMQMPGNGGMSNSSIAYSGVKEITEDTEISDETFESTNKDENAVLVTGDVNATLSNVTVNKTGDSEGGDSSNFYGNNSAILAKSGASLTLENIEVTTNANGANGVFCYGGSATTNNSASDGTKINISNSKITTTGNNAGGIMTTGGGTMYATNLTINTAGTSSAAIRTDRGGGTVNVDGGTYTTTGQGSPAIYSTADITVKNSKLISKASEGVVIEGKNSVTIENCELTDDNTKLNGQSTTYKNIFLYQSMSGDAADGTAEFTAKNSTITTNKGDTLYVTNTTASIKLENNTIVNNDNTGNFLRVQKDSWGNSGSNGGNVTLTLIRQKATGNIVIDSISVLSMNMEEESYFEGTINGTNEAKKIDLVLDSSSKIKLTGDSYVTSLTDSDTTYSNIDFNGYKLYVNGIAIN